MKFLKEKCIEFEEVDVSKDKKAREEMIKKSGRLEVPIVEIDGQIVVGFDKEKICKLLNINE
jgi:glutaredoxin